MDTKMWNRSKTDDLLLDAVNLLYELEKVAYSGDMLRVQVIAQSGRRIVTEFLEIVKERNQREK